MFSYNLYYEKPISSLDRIEKIFSKYGLVKGNKPDVIFAIGGDGTFLRAAANFRSKLIMPIKTEESIAKLIRYGINDLPKVLDKIVKGKYKIVNEPLIKCIVNKNSFYSVGDFYFQRGRENFALRYKIKIKNKKNVIDIKGIGDGFIVATPMGSTGYFSYVERLLKKRVKRINSFVFEHILPYHIEERINGNKRDARLRIRLDKGFVLEAYPERNLDQCIYSSSFVGRCIRISQGEKFIITDAKEKVSIIDI